MYRGEFDVSSPVKKVSCAFQVGNGSVLEVVAGRLRVFIPMKRVRETRETTMFSKSSQTLTTMPSFPAYTSGQVGSGLRFLNIGTLPTVDPT